MAYHQTISQEILLSTMPRVYIPMFLALVRYQKVFFKSILWMLLELVFTILLYLFNSLFSKLKSYSDKFGTCLFIVLCLTKLCESIKQAVKTGTGLICQRYRGVTGLNGVVFTKSKTRNIQTNLSIAENVIKAKITKDLLCFVNDDKKEN